MAGLTGSLNPATIADHGWAATYALLVEYMYEFYGHNRIWQDHYAHAAQYIDFVVTNTTDAEIGLFSYSRGHGHDSVIGLRSSDCRTPWRTHG